MVPWTTRFILCNSTVTNRIIAHGLKLKRSCTCVFLSITPQNRIEWRGGDTLAKGTNTVTGHCSGHLTKVEIQIISPIVKQAVFTRRRPNSDMVAVLHANIVYTEHIVWVMLLVTVVKSRRAKCNRVTSRNSEIFGWYFSFTIIELNISAISQSPFETSYRTARWRKNNQIM